MALTHKPSFWTSGTITSNGGVSPAFDLFSACGYSVDASYTVNAYSDEDFEPSDVDTSEDTVTVTGHGFQSDATGLVVQLTTTDTLPAGLSLTTDYYLIVIDEDTLAFGSNLANALADTRVDITDSGTGTHTIVDEAIDGAAIKLQASNSEYPASKDESEMTWFDVTSSSTNITATGTTQWNEKDVFYRWLRASVSLTDGSVTVNRLDVTAKG